jgi:hypothetical protein
VGVTTSRVNMIMAIRFPKMIVGQRRPLNGPSEIQTARREYTAVKALPRVGYSFYIENFSVSLFTVFRVKKWQHTIWAML